MVQLGIADDDGLARRNALALVMVAVLSALFHSDFHEKTRASRDLSFDAFGLNMS